MRVEADGRYECPSCGEEIVVPVDASAGEEQEYVEDCPVCCAPVQLTVRVEPDGEVTVVARAE
jgi:transcription elongation factor Elf1